MRWDHVTDYVGVLAEGVISYSVSANGKIVAMQRTRNVTANGVEQFGLDLLDFETKQITSLLDQTPLLSHLSISPDARWIKFSYQENPVGIYTVQTGYDSRAIGSPQQTNSPVELDLGEAQRDSPSEDILWSPDGQSLLWENPLGIWLYILATGEIRLVRSNIVTVSDPQNKTNEIEVSFQALDWSPAGRFALATVFPSSSDVSWQAILDTLTGRLVQVPDSYENNDWESDVDWMQNGDLLVMHASDSDNQKPPFIKVYHVFPTRNELLVFIDYQEIGEEFLRTRSSFSNLLPINLIWPHSLDARTLRMGITSGTASKPFLFSIDLQIDKLEKLLDLPQDTFDVLWTPDGQNALVLGTKGQIFFVALPRGPLRDVRPVLGKNAHDFFWLPPVPHF